LLIIAGLITVVAWQFHYGQLALYPFTLFATYAHEMGHGITAMILGGELDRLLMYPDGSGLAYWRGDMGRIARGMIAAGGLIGPSFAGALLLYVSRRRDLARWILGALGTFVLLTVVLFARGWFAPIFLAVMGIGLMFVARFFPERGAPFMLQLLGVQLCLALFRDVGYMFSEGGVIDGVAQRSDSAAIADALFLPYWFWGGLTALTSFTLLAAGLYLALRPKTLGATPTPVRPAAY
jgi:hypothetical protein